MLFSSLVERIYKSTVFQRYDERDTAFYFSHTDFEGINREDYSFKNYWGDELSAFFYYPDNEIEGRIVIFEHGLGAGHRSYMREIATLVSHGYRVLTYDRTGCASSPGETARGLSASLSDLDACIKAVRDDEKYSSFDISVVGHSWGGFSAMNISAYHPDVSHIVAMSGFSSLSAMLEQRFAGLLRRYIPYIYNLEKKNNPDYVDSDAMKALADTEAQVLIIHSTDDPVVSAPIHFKRLRAALSHKKNIRFLELDGKKHNPNYTASAVNLLADYQKSLKKKAKKLKTAEQKRAFLSSFDWYAITEQDESVWREIFATLDA